MKCVFSTFLYLSAFVLLILGAWMHDYYGREIKEFRLNNEVGSFFKSLNEELNLDLSSFDKEFFYSAIALYILSGFGVMTAYCKQPQFACLYPLTALGVSIFLLDTL